VYLIGFSDTAPVTPPAVNVPPKGNLSTCDYQPYSYQLSNSSLDYAIPAGYLPNCLYKQQSSQYKGLSQASGPIGPWFDLNDEACTW